MTEPAKKKSLHDLVEEYRELLWHIEDNDGVIEDEWFMHMNSLDADLADKVDRCLWVVDEFTGQAETYKKRADALARHAKSLKARGDRLKEYVKNSMERIGATRLSTPNYSTITIAKSPPSVYIADEESFIRDYRDTELVRTTHAPDKTAVKDRLKAGESVAHAELVTNRTSLRYR